MVAEIFFIVFGIAYILVVAKSLVPRPTPTRQQMLDRANERDAEPASTEQIQNFLENRQ